MIAWVGRRYAGVRDDAGAYAILYSLLVVVIFAFAAMVVDIAQAREDRRSDRVLTDNAALAGADHLAPGAGIDPYQACQDSWAYLANEWNVSVPGNACTPYSSYQPLTGACPSGTVSYPPVTVGDHTVVLAWPVPDNSTYMTNPDIKPGDQTQTIDTSVDGDTSAESDVPCTRLAVQISTSQGFNLATAFGASAVVVSDASVAINRQVDGPPREIAALNILNPHTCDAITTSGQGSILVDAVRDSTGKIVGKGIIAVESDGHDAGSSCPNNQPYVIDPNSNANNWICASGGGGGLHSATTSLGQPVNCDGKGTIESHALDPGSNAAGAYDPGLVPTNLAPQPTAEDGVYGPTPVTDLYGCASNACSSSLPIGTLTSTTYYGGTGMPIKTYPGVENAYTGDAFGTLNKGDDLATLGEGKGTFQCKGGNFYVDPGNWYVDCPDSGQTPGFQAGNSVFGGGTIVFAGGVQADNGNLAFNVPLGGWDFSSISVDTAARPITTKPEPSGDALVYIRGGVSTKGALSGSGAYSLYAPQTFFYLNDHNNGYLNFASNNTALFLTAPQAGSCSSQPTDALVASCQNAAFKKLVVWSECHCSGNQAQWLGGQGAVYLLGVFFTPYSEFLFTGQGQYASGAAQVWSDTLAATGQGTVILQPDPENAIARPAAQSALIR